MNGSSKLASAKAAYAGLEAQKGDGEVSPNKDNELHAESHDRSFNPVNGLPKSSVSEKLNQDAGRYRKGPGPV